MKIVYTSNDIGMSLLLKSIKTARKFFKREEIIVFYTPPRSRRNFQKLNKIATVKKVPNVTEPFVSFPNRKPSYYGEKIHLCEVDRSEIVFLDSDTIVKKDLRPLLEGNYDFSARVGSGYYQMNLKIWREMFSQFGKQPIPMPNTGFMIFKNLCHQKIKHEWIKYMKTPLPNPLSRTYLKEQYALALALTGKKIKWMTKKEHAFKWQGELGLNSYVVHGTQNPFIKKIELWGRTFKLKLLGEK